MKLLPNEELLVSSNEKKILLTNQRISLSQKEWGSAYRISLFLEDISSVEKKYQNHFTLLIAGILVLTISLLQLSNEDRGSMTQFLFLAGMILVISWYITRKHIIRICSNGNSAIHFETEKMSEDEVDDFIHTLELAKAGRRYQLYAKQNP